MFLSVRNISTEFIGNLDTTYLMAYTWYQLTAMTLSPLVSPVMEGFLGIVMIAEYLKQEVSSDLLRCADAVDLYMCFSDFLEFTMDPHQTHTESS